MMRNSRVLIIDDSATIRAMVEELLATRGGCPEIAIAADVETARALMHSFRPTVITLDLAMPGTGGLAFLDSLHDLPHAPVVVVSSATQDGGLVSEEAVAHGAIACFDKTKLIAEAGRFIRLIDRVSNRKALRKPRTTPQAAPTDPIDAAAPVAA